MSSFLDYSAQFLEHCYFGAYPTQEQIYELQLWGVNVIVDLTTTKDKNIIPYTTTSQVIKYPITDHQVPEDTKAFSLFIKELCGHIESKRKMYIHCKAGHGRSGIVVAAIFCQYLNLSPHDSLKLTKQCHSRRRIHARDAKMNLFWKNKGSPQTLKQKQFIITCFS